jgi:hypothetical protein
MCFHQDWNAMGAAVKTSPHSTSTVVHNAIISLLIIHIIPSSLIYVTIDIPSLVPSISGYITCWYHRTYAHPADDDSNHSKLSKLPLLVFFSIANISR